MKNEGQLCVYLFSKSPHFFSVYSGLDIYILILINFSSDWNSRSSSHDHFLHYLLSLLAIFQRLHKAHYDKSSQILMKSKRGRPRDAATPRRSCSAPPSVPLPTARQKAEETDICTLGLQPAAAVQILWNHLLTRVLSHNGGF